MLKRYQLWLCWILTIGLSISGSAYITSKPYIKVTAALLTDAGPPPVENTAQAATAAPQIEPAVPPVTNAVPGKLSDGVPILMYHSIAEADNTLCVSPADFEAQIDHILQQGYQTITVKHLLEALDGQAVLPPKPIVITFDDGYRDNYTVAYPILKARGMVATIYIIRQKIGTAHGMSIEELKELIDYGIEIGSHTNRHLDLRTLDDAGLSEEIINSRESISQLTGEPVVTFCYPSGRYSVPAVKKVEAASYLGAVTTHSGVMDDKSDRWLLPRIRVSGGESLEQFKASLPSN